MAFTAVAHTQREVETRDKYVYVHCLAAHSPFQNGGCRVQSPLPRPLRPITVPRATPALREGQRFAECAAAEGDGPALRGAAATSLAPTSAVCILSHLRFQIMKHNSEEPPSYNVPEQSV